MKKIKFCILFGWIIGMVTVYSFAFQAKEVRAAGYTEANILDFSGKWSNDYYLTDTNGEHWYKIVVPEDGKVQIKLMHYMGYVRAGLYNLDFSNRIEDSRLSGGTETAPETDTLIYELSYGTYYLKITGYDNGRYKINTTYISYQTKDANALSYDHPQMFSPGTQMAGALTYTDKEDWYKIIIKKDARYLFKLTHYMYSTYYEIFNEDLSKNILSGRNSGGDENSPEVDLNEVVLSAGTYYLKITGSRGKYLLDLNQVNQANCNHKYTSKYIYSTYFNRGYTLHKCEKCGKSYKDNYTAKKRLGQCIVSFYSRSGKGRLYLHWYTESDASGYQIRYCKRKKMKKGVKIKTVKGRTKDKKTIKGLARKKKYYIQIRAYRKSGGKIVYGKWSSKKCLRTR